LHSKSSRFPPSVSALDFKLLWDACVLIFELKRGFRCGENGFPDTEPFLPKLRYVLFPPERMSFLLFKLALPSMDVIFPGDDMMPVFTV
jgi:hypothetical protein